MPHSHTHTRLMALFSGTTQVSQYQKGKTNLDFTEARDSEWQWHQLGHMQVCTSLQTDNHTTQFLQARCPSCRPTNCVKALKAVCVAWLVINPCGIREDVQPMIWLPLKVCWLGVRKGIRPLVGSQEGHPACKSRAVRFLCGYLSGARCRLFACGPADATATPKPHHCLI